MLQILKTKRLKLREMELEDAPALQPFLNSPEQWLNQAVEPEEFKDAARRIQGYLEHRGEGSQRRLYVFVAELEDTGELVGQASLSRSHPAIASLGFGVSKTHTSKGIATEMVAKLIQYGFDMINLNRIEADVAVQNIASIRVLEKNRMKHEGTIREGIWAQGRWWDEEKYALLAGESQ